jgi:hypothetical protein
MIELFTPILMTFLAQEALPEPAYVTAAPVPSVLGLATLGGRYAVQLGEGCDRVVPGVNVILYESPDEPWLRVVDPFSGVLTEVCAVTHRQHVSDVPCATNAAGACDVAFS